jgi:hypothetical protein
VLAPVVAPFKVDLASDSQRFIAKPTNKELKAFFRLLHDRNKNGDELVPFLTKSR